jgi:hypothetical protein
MSNKPIFNFVSHMRSAFIISAAFIAVACLSPSTVERRNAAAVSAERDVAAAIGTWTVRAYQPIVADATVRDSLSALPANQFGGAPVWLVESGDSGYVTVIGPYRNSLTGRDEVTRVEMRRVDGKMVATYYTRALKSGQASRGTYVPMPSMVVAAN